MSTELFKLKRGLRQLADRLMVPYVDLVVQRLGARALPCEIPDRVAEEDPRDSTTVPSTVQQPNGTSDYFHIANHELRTLELERVPKGAKRALSVGAQGRWYFDWFERSIGTVEEHIGVEAYEPRPDDLPPYVKWVTDTADHMIGVADASVDLVFAGQTSEHLWAHELAGFLSESHRVLAEDGLLALDSPNRLVTEHLLWSHGGHTIELSADEMSELLELAGFAVLSVTGVWSCVVDGRILTLEEGIDDPAIFARRAASARESPNEAFVWWINARRLNTKPEVERLRERVNELFATHWNTRVNRGLYEPGGNTQIDIPVGTSGQIGATLPFPLHGGPWTITAQLATGNWADLAGFRLRIVAPGPHVVHDLDLASAVAEGSRASWSFDQPYLLFALSIEIVLDSPSQGLAALSLPLQVDFHGE